MVDKFKEILAELKKAKKPVILFAILKMDDITDRWSVIYSASNIRTDEEKRDEFVYLVNLIVEHLSPDEREQIARVGVFSPTTHLIDELLRYKRGYDFAKSTPVNGNVVHEGSFILESKGPHE